MSNHLAEKLESKFFSKLEESGRLIPDDLKYSIQRRIKEISSYTPRVGVFGKTGVGKSSMCNALFGQDICPISDVSACTRNPQEVMLSLGGEGQNIILLDVPGVGEDRERDKEYDELYRSLLPQLDLIFWVFKGDDRANASDEDFYNRLIKPYIKEGKPFIAVINQIDKIEPFREWDEDNNMPGPKQRINIDAKRSHIARFLELPIGSVIPVSANERYGLVELVDAIVHALPNEQKMIVLNSIETAEEQRKKQADELAEQARQQAEEARLQAEEIRKQKEEAERKLIEAQRESEEVRQKAIEEEKRLRKELAEKEEQARKEAAAAREAAEQARREREREVVTSETRRKAEKGFWTSVGDFIEKIPVVGSVFGWIRSLF